MLIRELRYFYIIMIINKMDHISVLIKCKDKNIYWNKKQESKIYNHIFKQLLFSHKKEKNFQNKHNLK